MTLFIFTKAVHESLFTETPILLTHNNWYRFSLPVVGLIDFAFIIFSRLQSSLVVPACLMTPYLLKKLQNRVVLFGCLMVLLAGLVLSIDFNFDKGKAIVKHMSIYQYIIGSALIFFGSLLCENVLIVIISKVSAPIASLGLLNASFTSAIGDTLGRSIGNVAVGVASSISGPEFIALYLYSFYSVLAVILVICSALLYKRLRRLTYAQRIIEHDTLRLPVDNKKAVPSFFQPFEGEAIQNTQNGGQSGPEPLGLDERSTSNRRGILVTPIPTPTKDPSSIQ